VKHEKSSRDGELIKRCAIKMANAFSDSKIAEKFKTVSQSHHTVSRRVSEVAGSVSDACVVLRMTVNTFQ
jgi:hypothetical protein